MSDEKDGFVQSGQSPATDTEVKIKDVLNVKDFGAKGDGITDDTDAFKRAFDYAMRERGGFMIFVPPGFYKGKILG